MSKKNILSTIIIILLLISLLFLLSRLEKKQEFNAVVKAVVVPGVIVQESAAGTNGFFTNLWNNYIWLVEVKKENQALKQRLNLLSGKISLCLEIEKENNQLRTLFNMTPQTESKRLVARVIGVSPSPFVRMLKLNQGSEKGVKKGMAVKAPQGVVGFVFRVFKNYCDVLTITDPRSSVDIIVFRNRTRGMVKGSGSSEDISCSVHYILKETDLIVGDKVVTSGMGNRFPKGLPVGEVAKISKKPYGFYLQARLKPAVDLSRLEYAEILLE